MPQWTGAKGPRARDQPRLTSTQSTSHLVAGRGLESEGIGASRQLAGSFAVPEQEVEAGGEGDACVHGPVCDLG
jgi:hypothetical protein